ncbi:hypothetical protein CSOJ01_13499 [Colletotrichum sojae]|uniref:Uncharacterized protein n=1 Tax=Colletotrichum sojae TaxID=2175907 RepID=A0A8H6IS85_9PEZI|nr:hypothetical protein CSOJ01_13499 [Colletotrichum sojae]
MLSPGNGDDLYFELDPLVVGSGPDGAGVSNDTALHNPGSATSTSTRSQRGSMPETPSSMSSAANKAAEKARAALTTPTTAAFTTTPNGGHRRASSTGNIGISNNASSPSRDAPMDERLGSVMEQAEAAGFASFDELVMAYYGEQLDESSPLANEQRLSRNRRLPRVVSDVYRRAGGWSSWERRGFYEEMLKIAEAMLASEGAAARASLAEGILPLADGGDRDKVCLRIRRMVQEQVPNLWALNSGLVANDGDWRQRDRSNAALGSILLMHCAGRMPKEQLLGLLEMCL